MTSVAQPPHHRVRQQATQDHSVGIFLIEAHSLTPMGPKILFANETAAQLTGYDVSSLINSSLGLIYDRSDLSNLIRSLPSIATRPNFCWMNRVMRHRDGTLALYRWTIRPTNRRETPTKYFTVTLSPMKEDKPEPPNTLTSVSFASSASTNQPDEGDPSSNESLAVTAMGVAHDFKNALQAIKSNLELAKIASAQGDDVQGYLTEADFALIDAESLAGQMLALSRGDSNEKVLFQIEPLLTRVSHLCMAGSDVRPQVTTSKHHWQIKGIPDQIYRVLHNLVMNACQAMPNGGFLHLTSDNATFAEDNAFSVPPGKYIVVSVRDRGQGIPPQDLSRIFERRFTTKEKGSGIGLFHCRQIVETHGGSIRVASKIGVGTEFLIFLPAIDIPPRSTHDPRLERMKSNRLSHQLSKGVGKVLVVEDQPDVARAACTMLKYLGYESSWVDTGERAVNYFREHSDPSEAVNAVLLDMTLPGGMNGYDVLRAVKRLDPEVCVIATSGYFDDNQAIEPMLADGFSGILAKPYPMDKLAQLLDEVLSF